MSKHLLKNNLITRWLDGRLTIEEEKRLEQTEELDGLKAVLDDIDTWKLQEFDVEKGLTQLTTKKEEVSHFSKKKSMLWIQIAASVALLCSSYFLWNYDGNRDTIIETGVAEKKSIKLPAGSLVKLDAASILRYSEKEWKDNRSLSLSGQAFFEVTNGTTFHVTTPTAKIKVLGTRFNVLANKESITVHCYHGKVQVFYQGHNEIIEKGQAVLAKDKELSRSDHDDSVPIWTQGYSIYDQEVLSEVIRDIQKYYPITIQLPQRYAFLKFTGTIGHRDLNKALNTLFTSMELTYDKQGNKIIVK